MSRIRTNLITNRMANGAPTVSNGLVISGVTTSTNVSVASSVTATTFYGSGANLTGIDTDLVSDTSPQLGGDLASNSHDILFADNDKAIFGTGSDFKIYHNGTDNYIMASNGHIRFDTGSAELARITSTGKLLVGTQTEGAAGADELTIATTGSTGLTIRSGTSNDGNIFFSDATSGTGEYAGYIQFEHANNALRFGTVNAERLRIDSSGQIGINEASNINGRLHVQHDALAENILYATRYNDQSNDKPILAITEAQMTGMGSGGLVIGNHNRDIHIGPVFDSSAAVTTSNATGLRIMSTGKVGVGIADPSQAPFVSYAASGTSIAAIKSNNGASISLGGVTQPRILLEAGASASDFIVYTAGGSSYGSASWSEKFRINSNGQVTQPSQPSFAAYRNQDAYSLNNEVFPFNVTRHNTGSHFNTGNHRFTAPVAGRYMFTFYSILNSQVNSGIYSFRVNNSTSYGHNVHFTTVNSHWDHVSTSQIMNLSANDYVTMWSNSNVNWHGNGWQIFCGELLS